VSSSSLLLEEGDIIVRSPKGYETIRFLPICLSWFARWISVTALLALSVRWAFAASTNFY